MHICVCVCAYQVVPGMGRGGSFEKLLRLHGLQIVKDFFLAATKSSPFFTAEST